MLLNFPMYGDEKKFLTNYDLFMMPNGVYRAKEIKADNYLYPIYYLKEGNGFVVSTSVYALIHYKKRFIRNPRFQVTHFFRPTFMTIDEEIMRARTEYRRSTLELTGKYEIIKRGAELIQSYITEIEKKYPGHVHILLMGGKDSQNIILAKRSAKWIVVSGEPSSSANREFIDKNKINIERFIPVSNETDNTFLLEEIMASDCAFDVAHFRWVRDLDRIIKENGGKAVIWIGTDGDGIFSKNNNHRDSDYYALHDLHVGTAMGVWHQMLKNLFNIPVVSPYQSPRFMNELFYRFDPYFVVKAGDVRPEIGQILFGRPVKYPVKNATPDLWKRNRFHSIPAYVNQVRKEGITCVTRPLGSLVVSGKERVCDFFNRHSCKRRTALSKVLFPVRRRLGETFPALRIKRHNIAENEIR